ncbi:unnamed protein product [Prorocentrum cordatum]|uniref:EF-hand domain-containing protein n=2 Tax=Prorocentrum cordatum TaxID=2364126 RepID=A0ABN9VB73_9DINO|nr:unnamed protein product [Polarella glacialis]
MSLFAPRAMRLCVCLLAVAGGQGSHASATPLCPRQMGRCQEDDEEDFGDMDVEEDSLSAEQLRGLHAKLDGNGDGKASLREVLDFSQGISKAMAARDIEAIMEEIDTSKDGKVSLQEHLDDFHGQGDASDDEEAHDMEVRKEVEKAKFAAADMDGDQQLDKAELAALFYPEIHDRVLDITVQEALRQKDTNGDGKLSAMEFWEIDPADGDDGEMLEDEQRDFAKLDSNGDGLISAEEMRHWESGAFHVEDAMQKLFDLSDANSDMHVTADELVAVRGQVGATDAHFHLIEWAEHHEL